MSGIMSLGFYIALFGISVLLLWYGGRRGRVIFAVIGIFLLSLVAAIRFDVGTDYGAYATAYQLIHSLSLSEFLSDYGQMYEVGVYLLAKLAATVPFSVQFFFGLFSFLTLLFFYLATKKYTNSGLQFFLISFLYIFTMFPTSFNAVRQMLAISIFFYATTFIFDKRLWKYVALTALAALFHKSAILLLPVYFLGRLFKKEKMPTLRQIILISCIVGMILLLSSAILSQILATPFFDKYDKYQSISAASGGLILTLKVGILLGVTAMYKHIKKYPYFTFCLIMSVVEVLILIIARSSVDLSRFSAYFSIFPIILLAYIPNTFDYRGRMIAAAAVLLYGITLFYLSFYILQGSEIFPYQYSLQGGWQ